MNPFLVRALRVTAVLALFYPCVVFAQFRIPGIGDIGNVVDLEDIIASIPGLGSGEYEEALTTTLDDAVTEVPFLDDYNPVDFEHLWTKPGAPPGTYILSPGHWEIELESYCLRAGSHGPGRGNGYLYAPLKGPCAEPVRHILVNSCAHPEIPQHDIQLLIWGILSRTKISDMSEGPRRAAQVLLTSEEIRQLNGGALGVIPEEMLNEVFARVNLPPAVRRAIEAEARIRSLITGGSSFSQIEQIAVLAGDAPEDSKIREVPEGRWSYHPGGYFVRYKPSGYSRTLMQVSVPDWYTFELDYSLRIVSVTDSLGSRFEVEYDDTVTPLTFGGTTEVSGYAFGNLRFTMLNMEGEEVRSDEWRQSGWTLAGVPDTESAGSSTARYTGVQSRVRWAQAHRSEVEALAELMPESDLRTVLASLAVHVGLLANAVQETVAEQTGEEAADEEVVLFLKEAWQYLVCLIMDEYDPLQNSSQHKGGTGRKAGEGSGGGDGDGLNPAGDGAMPGFDLSQRLGTGDEMSPEERRIFEEAKDYADGYERGYRGGKQSGGRRGWRDVVQAYPYPPIRPFVPSYVPERTPWDEPWRQGYCDGWEDGWWAGYDSAWDLWNALDEYVQDALQEARRRRFGP